MSRKYSVWVYKNINVDFFENMIYAENSFPLREDLIKADFVGLVMAYGETAFKERYADKLRNLFWGYKRGKKLPMEVCLKRLSKERIIILEKEKRENLIKKRSARL